MSELIQEQKDDKMKRSEIENLPHYLKSLIEAYEEAYANRIEPCANRDVVVCIGNAGGGKSTLLNSIV